MSVPRAQVFFSNVHIVYDLHTFRNSFPISYGLVVASSFVVLSEDHLLKSDYILSPINASQYNGIINFSRS